MNSANTGGTLSVSAVNTCGTSQAQTLAINIPAIDISTNIIGNTIYANQSGVNYQWLDCSINNSIINGETNQMYSVTSNGIYAVAIDLSGCVDTSTCVTMTILGADNYLKNHGIQVYPNPTTDNVNIACSRPTFIRVYNSLGQLIESFTVQNQYVLHLERYNVGLYYLQTNDSKSIKLVKQ